jgi:hypothetical protein
MRAVVTPRIRALLEPAYLDGLADLAMADIRAKRAECQEVETGLSYLRRMVQGRLDIVHADMQRRADGGSGDLADLVAHLKDILSEKVHAPGNGRLQAMLEPADLPEVTEMTAELDRIAHVDQLTQLPELDDAQVQGLAEALGEFEREVSSQRRALHERIDALQEEIVRRYKSGEATVDSLLA